MIVTSLSLLGCVMFWIWGMVQKFKKDDVATALYNEKNTRKLEQEMNVNLKMFHNHIMTLYIESARRNRGITLNYNTLLALVRAEFIRGHFGPDETKELFERYGLEDKERVNHSDDWRNIVSCNVAELKSGASRFIIPEKERTTT
jgi:hypothetical protein